MKYILILALFLINNCSLNKDSHYWTEDTNKRKVDQKKIAEIFKKSVDITTMTSEEYDIYIDEYVKKSNYPNISE